MTDQHILLARQPIFDVDIKVSAYELLFRSDGGTQANVLDGDTATSQVLLNAFNELDISDVVQNHPAYINFTRTLILSPPPFDKKRFVIEVLEDIEADEELMRNLRSLKDAGYTIALDDFVYDSKWDPALRIADIVKIDVLAFDEAEIKRHVELLKPFKVTLLAEKVETHEMFHYCKGLGFTLFQGYFLSKPEQVKGHKIPASKLVVLNLLTQLQDPNAELSDIATIIAEDPVLSVKLIKLVNSAAFSGRREITSLQHAVSMLGLRQVKSWATLLSLSNMAAKPNELSVQAMTRAKMCQLLAECFTTPADSDVYFTTGLLSNLDAFFDVELAQIIASMPLSPVVTEGLLERSGPIGLILNAVLAYEQALWDEIDQPALALLNISSRKLECAYLDSIRWASELGAAVQHA
ncbi:MAG: HDOD domain-containing protein [Pseudomonadales bacterium]|nr:HDOD domain-containing protein [Pseudomonadales bacterium]MCP5331627.1 HDOD domain-containing protein [Pseudomonadales bacterium]